MGSNFTETCGRHKWMVYQGVQGVYLRYKCPACRWDAKSCSRQCELAFILCKHC